MGGEVPVEAIGLLGWGGGDEARAAATRGVGVEGELGDDEGFAGDVEEAQVGLAVLVAEDTELGDLIGETLGGALVVVGADAEEDAEAGADLAAAAVPGDGGAADALEDGSHLRRSEGRRGSVGR